MVRKLLMLLMLGMILTILPRIIGSLIYNLILISLDWGELDAGEIWYGIGSHDLSGSNVVLLTEWITLYKTKQEVCGERERYILETYARLPFRLRMNDQDQRRDIALQARRAICEGQQDKALEILRRSGRLIQHLSVLYSLGRGEEAASLASKYICKSDTDWCNWCVMQMFSTHRQHEEFRDGALWRYTNDLEGRYFPDRLTSLGPLYRRGSTGLIVTRKVPLTIKGVVSKHDNYIEYLTLPIAGSAVRYRLRGIVAGKEAESCILPRLVFLGEEGDYLGEVALRYDIKGKFEVELWWPLPPNVRKITPRVTFDKGCFAEGQEIAVCSIDLAVIP